MGCCVGETVLSPVCVLRECPKQECNMLPAAAWGRAGTITISISVDQREASSNPGFSPGSRTPQLRLILPSFLLTAEQEGTF